MILKVIFFFVLILRINVSELYIICRISQQLSDSFDNSESEVCLKVYNII